MTTPGTVHGSSLGRWFEQLCRIDYKFLKIFCTANQTALKPRVLPTHGGVYAFWWTGPIDLLASGSRRQLLDVPGSSGRMVRLQWDDEWLGISTRLPVPLYVGKAGIPISQRVGQHLMLKSERLLDQRTGHVRQRGPTTSCQLRAGVEHMFPKEDNPRRLILDNIGLSVVNLDGDSNAANRFYLEDLAIGLMRPPLNVDIER